MSDSEPPRSLRVSQAAAYLNITVNNLRWLADNGVIPSQRTLPGKGPGHRRFKESDLEIARRLMELGHSHDYIKDYFTDRYKRERANFKATQDIMKRRAANG
jgi:excisionase family DNA binding protein